MWPLTAFLDIILTGCATSADPTQSDGSEADSAADTAVTRAWYRDADGDSYGDARVSQDAILVPTGFVADGSDCDDTDATVFPGALETCNSVDDDCDGFADDGVATATWYLDADADGWGNSAAAAEACAALDRYVAESGDCDDSDALVNPEAMDICENGIDEDCTGNGDARCRLEGTISLADAPVKYLGDTAGGIAGYPVSCGRDTDGNGASELLIGEMEQFAEELSGVQAFGGAWLVEPRPTGTHLLEDHASASVWGEEGLALGGEALQFLDDLDGDGLDEALAADAIFSGPVVGTWYASDADARLVHDYESIKLGYSAASLGEGQFVLAGPGNLYQDGNWGAGVGAAFVFEGPLSGEVSTADAVASLAPSVYHEHGNFGSAICSGDFDGDGNADVLAGAPAMYPTSYPDFMLWGAAYVVHGPFAGDLRMAQPDGTLLEAVARIQGSGVESSNTGFALSCAGDTNADGLDDLLVGAIAATDGDTFGSTFLFHGPVAGVRTVDEAEGAVRGNSAGDYLGSSVSLDADLDGDGRHDAAIGSYADASRGEVSIFYGGFSGKVDVSSADVTLRGEAEGDSAATVAGCPDLDGDGFDDLLIGAGAESTIAPWAGAAYVVFGGGG